MRMNPQGEENNGFGPITKPRKRIKQRVFNVFILLVAFLSSVIFIIYRQEDVKEHFSHLWSVSSASIFGALIGEFVRRLGLFVEEYQHRMSRYSGSWKKALSACFISRHLKFQIMLGIISLVVLVLIYTTYANSADVPYMVISFVVTAFMVPMILDLADLYYPTRCERSFVDETEKKSMAEGFAWAIYFGYFKHVLPNFKTRVVESEMGRDLAIRKFLILIPRDCYIPPTVHDGRITLVGTLPETVVEGTDLNFGGQKVYKIRKENGEEISFVAEFPRIVQRLLQMAEHNAPGLLRHEDKDEQVMMFYHSLDNLLRNYAPDCAESYLLVPYAGRESDLAEVILRAIHNETVGGVPVH